MIAYILRRLIWMMWVLTIVSILSFLLVHLAPGDVARVIGGIKASEETIQKIREQLELDKPLHLQFVYWLKKLFTGELQSLYARRSVFEIIMYKLPVTASIALGALVVALVIGFPLGLIAAVKQGSWLDRIGVMTATLGVSIPTFWLGMNLILFFAVQLKWLPSGGFVRITEDFGGWVRSIILPSFSLGFVQAALLARMTRSCVLEVLKEDYVTTARSKGLRESVVLLRHALRNAMITIVTVIGLIFGLLLGGAVVTEQVFTLPGVGRMVVEAVSRRDYPTVQGVIIFIAFAYASVNLIVDILYAFLDPRIRYD
ncbi:MAG: ABC transporter permease [Deltaproteobacteria bacterium]|nr:ABC transporter permease [Deltaproteobacteria bacterium]MBW2151310.1 ABC transporter permease [Deltaproteobacteria bacterium]